VFLERRIDMPTIAKLRVEAQKLDIVGYSRMNKKELQAAISDGVEDVPSEIMGSGVVVSDMINLRRSELAAMARERKIKVGGMTKDQIIAVLSDG
jgi:hypothetical protein